MSSFIKIGIIGDFDSERPSHKATNEALNHCANYLGINIDFKWLPTESLEVDANKSLTKFDGLWCAPGSPYKSMKGMQFNLQEKRTILSLERVVVFNMQ